MKLAFVCLLFLHGFLGSLKFYKRSPLSEHLQLKPRLPCIFIFHYTIKKFACKKYTLKLSGGTRILYFCCASLSICRHPESWLSDKKSQKRRNQTNPYRYSCNFLHWFLPSCVFVGGGGGKRKVFSNELNRLDFLSIASATQQKHG